MTRDAFSALLVTGLLATLIGQIVRDRLPGPDLLMYLPAVLIAPVVLLADLLRRGRTLRGPRFSLSLLALVSLGIDLPRDVGLFPCDARDPNRPSLRLLQWNVMWGGSWEHATHWPAVVARIVAAGPDLVVLSEAPVDEEKLETLRQALGPGWQIGRHDFVNYDTGYVSRVRVLSRFPVAVESIASTPTATVATLRVGAPHPFRLMTADAISGPGEKHAILKFIASEMTGTPRIDVACGDFNAVLRDHSFRRITTHGFRDVSEQGFTWRPTWPSMLPVFDIDHTFVRDDVRVLGTQAFSVPPLDHRARVTDLQLPADGFQAGAPGDITAGHG